MASEEAPSAERFLKSFRNLLPEDDAREFHDLLQRAASSTANNDAVADFAESIGSKNGISGYSYHTVPCVLQVWFGSSQDFAEGLQEIIQAGGDTDTAGAIYGGIVGARVGRQGIPASWLSDIIEWPRTIKWVERLASTTATAVSERGQSQGSKASTLFLPGHRVTQPCFSAHRADTRLSTAGTAVVGDKRSSQAPTTMGVVALAG